VISVNAPARPRDVFCVIEHLHRSTERAEEICAGRYTHQGQTLELGEVPDWTGANLPTDKEWGLEWRKFYFGLDLAWAFRETGNRKFLHAWERAVRSFIHQVPVGSDPSEVTARRIQNWIYAWNGFARASSFAGLGDGVAEEVVGSLREQVEHLRHHLTRERNHRTLELYALFIAAIALPLGDPDGQLLDFSVSELHKNLLADVRADGTHRESSTHYHMVVLRSFLGLRENARRFNLCLPEDYDRHLARACEFAMHCHRPDGAIPALSDSDTGSYLDLLQLAGALLAREDFLYVATRGTRGRAPLERHASFTSGGYFVQRSGWGGISASFGDERFLIFDCGPLGDGGHGHYDLLNIEVAAGGGPLVVDPGRFTYLDAPQPWRRWFKGSAAHNTVTVDDLDQTPYSRGKPKGPVAHGEFLGRFTSPTLDVLWGRAESPCYDAVHERRILFVANEYWIIEDCLRATTLHDYTLRFHLSEAAWNHTDIDVQGECTVVRAPGLALILSHGVVTLDAGWVAPRYGIKLPAPVVAARQHRVAVADFISLVVPLRGGARTPTVRVARAEGGAPVTYVEVDGVGQDGRRVDRVAWSASGNVSVEHPS
jgi:Heparinase II/III-like protein/Heparinase II/III N-terminus